MATTTRTAAGARRASSLNSPFRSSIGKKMIMAVTGLLMLAFVIVHMLGNLKVFEGAEGFNSYAAFLRALGEPILLPQMYLWVQRVVLLAALVLHVWAAVSLTRQDVRARPVGYVARRRGGYSATLMRWGGFTLLLFIVYHILDLTMGVANPAGSDAEVYDRLVADFQVWYITLIYVLAMVALCLHIAHGLWSAATTLGSGAATTATYRTAAVAIAVVIAVGFLIPPLSIAFGLVE